MTNDENVDSITSSGSYGNVTMQTLKVNNLVQ